MKRVLPHFSGSLGQFPTLTYFAKNEIIYFYYCPILVMAIFNITYSKPPISSNFLIFPGLVFTISAIFYPFGKNSFLVIFFSFFFFFFFQSSGRNVRLRTSYGVFSLTYIFWWLLKVFLFLLLSLALNSEICKSSFPNHFFELILYVISYCSLSDSHYLTWSSLLVNLNTNILPGCLKNNKQNSKMVYLEILRYLIIQVEIILLLIFSVFHFFLCWDQLSI